MKKLMHYAYPISLLMVFLAAMILFVINGIQGLTEGSWLRGGIAGGAAWVLIKVIHYASKLYYHWVEK